MNILVIPTWYRTAKNPNGGIFVYESVKGLRNAGVNAAILFVDLDHKKINQFLKEPKISFNNDDIPTWRADGFGMPKKNQFLLDKWSNAYLDLMEKYLSENEKPDVIHAHSFFAGYAALRLSQKYQIPYVVTEHFSAFLTGELESWKKTMIREVFDKAVKVIAVSEVLKSAIQQYTSNVVDVIPNAIDTDFFQQEDSPKSKDKFQFITVGGVRKEKQYEQLINSFQQLTSEVKTKCCLKIIGNGPLENQLIRQIENLPTENEVKFLGELNREGVLQHLQMSNVFVCSSAYETFGVAILEAMSVGLPVLSTKCKGPESFINAENGRLTALEELSLNMEWMYHHSDAFDSKKIRAFVEENFSAEMVTLKQIELYENVLL